MGGQQLHARLCRRKFWEFSVVQFCADSAESPLNETITRGPLCVWSACKKITLRTQVKDPVVHVKIKGEYGNTQIALHALKVSKYK